MVALPEARRREGRVAGPAGATYPCGGRPCTTQRIHPGESFIVKRASGKQRVLLTGVRGVAGDGGRCACLVRAG